MALAAGVWQQSSKLKIQWCGIPVQLCGIRKRSGVLDHALPKNNYIKRRHPKNKSNETHQRIGKQRVPRPHLQYTLRVCAHQPEHPQQTQQRQDVRPTQPLAQIATAASPHHNSAGHGSMRCGCAGVLTTPRMAELLHCSPYVVAHVQVYAHTFSAYTSMHV